MYDPLMGSLMFTSTRSYKYIVMSGSGTCDDQNVLMYTSQLTEALKKAIDYDYNVYSYTRPHKVVWRNP